MLLLLNTKEGSLFSRSLPFEFAICNLQSAGEFTNRSRSTFGESLVYRLLSIVYAPLLTFTFHVLTF
jgi:hypothetical protein